MSGPNPETKSASELDPSVVAAIEEAFTADRHGFSLWIMAANCAQQIRDSAVAEAVRERDERWQQAIGIIRSYYPEDVFLPGSTSSDAIGAEMARRTCDNILDLFNAPDDGLGRGEPS